MADHQAVGGVSHRSRGWIRWVSAGVVAGIALGVGLVLVFGRGQSAAARDPARPRLVGEVTWPAGSRAAPGFSLSDQDGRMVSLRGQLGRTVLLTFMDPACRTECPIEGALLARAERMVSPADRPVLMVVTVNAPATTRARVSADMRRWGDWQGAWHWMTGSTRQLAAVWRAYGIQVKRVAGDVEHTSVVYVIDRAGFERAGFSLPFEPSMLATDLRVLGP